jgi:hypothetical protein
MQVGKTRKMIYDENTIIVGTLRLTYNIVFQIITPIEDVFSLDVM